MPERRGKGVIWIFSNELCNASYDSKSKSIFFAIAWNFHLFANFRDSQKLLLIFFLISICSKYELNCRFFLDYDSINDMKIINNIKTCFFERLIFFSINFNIYFYNSILVGVVGEARGDVGPQGPQNEARRAETCVPEGHTIRARRAI
jgi:hypothetical protein